MKVYFKSPTEIPHVNPVLKAGAVYREDGSGQVYLGVMIPIKDCANKGYPKPHLYLINVITGERYSDSGFNNSKFHDITAISTLTVEGN